MDGPELNYCTADGFESAEEKWNLAFWDGYCDEDFDREMFRAEMFHVEHFSFRF